MVRQNQDYFYSHPATRDCSGKALPDLCCNIILNTKAPQAYRIPQSSSSAQLLIVQTILYQGPYLS